ncbi:MAG: acetoacetate--CoA ligase [bacterium]|nr:acetoacetate--CoA ligase [bacterium]
MSVTSPDANSPLWTPSAERVASARMTAYMRWLGDKHGHAFSSYHQLYQWSIEQTDQFWKSIWEYGEIIHSHPPTSILDDNRMPGARWFASAKLNFAENLLRYRDDRIALISYREQHLVGRLTYAELYRQVAAAAAGLKKAGVGRGDRVAAYIPNQVEAVIAMLATTSLGAIWSSCSPDFGLQGALDRLSQISPKVLIAADGYQYLGKQHSCLDVITHLVDQIPAIQHAFVVNNIGSDLSGTGDRIQRWDQLLDLNATEIIFAQLPFDHPIYIMYSSGTTGKPKCIVHGAGGTLLQHFKELALHTDLRRDDTIFYFTTCGWMMWNWLVSSLMIGATIVLYDGSPAYPSVNSLWEMADHEKISIFGTSPKFLSTCQHAGIRPIADDSLPRLRTILSTGSPLTAENFSYVYRDIKADIQLSSISGGTDIISCFMLGNPVLPVYAEEIQCRGLGMQVEAFDNSGRPVIEQTGELVCTKPFPSMPVSFWDDPDGAKYRAAYFDVYPGVWRHGDYIKITSRGGVVVFGRSDATLNPGGVRIGTAEIYNPVEAMPEIKDSLVIGQRWNNDIRIVLFVVLHDEYTLDDDLKKRIRESIRRHNTPRHVPSVILQIREVPRTLNAKKVEVAVTRIIHGDPVTNREALVNPDSLRQFENLPELRV